MLFVGNFLFVYLTERSQSLQLLFIVSAVRSPELENLVLSVAARLAQQRPVGAWNPGQTQEGFTKDSFLLSKTEKVAF